MFIIIYCYYYSVYINIYIYTYIYIEREIILVEIVSVFWGVKQSCLIVATFVSMHIYIYIYTHVCVIFTSTAHAQYCFNFALLP